MLCKVTSEIALQHRLEAVEAPARLHLHGLALLSVLLSPVGVALRAEAAGLAMLPQGRATFEGAF